jgi:hypothetical protein
VEEDGNLTRIYNNIARHQGRDVLSTIREQKYLLHHRSHCRYRHRPQSARLVLAQGPSGTYGYNACLNSSRLDGGFSSSNESEGPRPLHQKR